MIDIDVLKKLYDNCDNYFIGLINGSVRFFTLPYEARIIFINSENFEEITIKELQQLSDLHLEQNISLSCEYTPFQIGLKIREIKDVYVLEKVPNNILERIIEVRKTQKSLRVVKRNYEDFLNNNIKVDE